MRNLIMGRWRRRAVLSIVVLATTVVIGITLILVMRSGGEKLSEVRIATGTEGGTYYPLGQHFARILTGELHVDALADVTDGSVDNVRRLIDGEAELAFVMQPALVSPTKEDPQYTEPELGELTALARLYLDVVHILVRKTNEVESLAEWPTDEETRFYIGALESATRLVAKNILKTIGFEEYTDVRADDTVSFSRAIDLLKSGELDAAFIAAGTPTTSVRDALQSGEIKLLSLSDKAVKRLVAGRVSEAGDSAVTTAAAYGFEPVTIPASFYENQLDPVLTVGAPVYLVCHKDLEPKLASRIVAALFDHLPELLVAHTKAQDIRLDRAFADWADSEGAPVIDLHPGAEQFQNTEGKNLLIATGSLNGKYYNLGTTIEDLLKQRGINARATQTAGSLENIRLLTDDDDPFRTLAILQLDVALASSTGMPERIYKVDKLPTAIPHVRDIRLIATLHEEKLHIIVRRSRLRELLGKEVTTFREFVEVALTLADADDGQMLRVCLGASMSGTRFLGEAILEHLSVPVDDMTLVYLSSEDMVQRLYSGEVDVGFFVSYTPSEAMELILEDRETKLLSIGPKRMARLVGSVIKPATIPADRYGCQLEGEDPIQTIKTQAVLVAREDLPNVYEITKAIVEGAALLGMNGEDMAQGVSTMELHPDATRFYEAKRYLPPKLRIHDRLFEQITFIFNNTWRFLAILLILVTGYRGVLLLRRDGTSNRIGRRILAIPVEASVRDSVQRLLEIREEIQARVRRRWWRWGELDRRRWRQLHDLIDDRMTETQDTLARLLVAEIRALADDHTVDQAARRERCRSLERRVLEYLEKGELDAPQQQMLSDLLQEPSRHVADAD